jgi:predicted  nucleic acid-binding Zn-ribbon protein
LNKNLEKLIELAKYDKEINAFDPGFEAQESKLKALENAVKDADKKLLEAYQEADNIKSLRVKNDINLGELKEKLDKISTKYDSISTEKELKALQLEEEIAKEQISATNEEIARLDKLSLELDNKIKELKEELAKKEEEKVIQSTEVEQAIEELKAQKDVIVAKKEELLKEIDSNVLNFYNKIRNWAGDSAVVPMKKQACYGCYIKVNDVVYTNVIRAEDITTCPHCGRILYKEQEEEA